MRVEDYNLDNNITINDWLFGSDGDNMRRTRNFAVRDLLNLVASYIGSGYGNSLISGGAVWISGLTYEVSVLTYFLDSEFSTSEGAIITLNDADSTYDRFDVIVVDAEGEISVIQGDAVAEPVKPTVPFGYLEVTFAYIAAGASEPTGVSRTAVYSEGVEAPDEFVLQSLISSYLVLQSGDDIYAGTYAFYYKNAVQTGRSFQFVSETTLNYADYSTLHLYLKFPAAISLDAYIDLSVGDEDGEGSTIRLRHTNYGLDFLNTSEYQSVIIPLTDFINPPTEIVKFGFDIADEWNGDFLLDEMFLVSGVNNSGTVGQWTALIDTPNYYTGHAGKVPIVKENETGLEFFDISELGNSSTGLERIDEGNGEGWKLIDADNTYHGNIGFEAIDLSWSISGTNRGATGAASIAIGKAVIADAQDAIAIGTGADAGQVGAVAIGRSSKSASVQDVALGQNTNAYNGAAVALGSGAWANSQCITAGYNSRANAYYGVVIGTQNTSNTSGEIILGSFAIETPNTGTFLSTSRLFTIGCGTSTSNRANALEMIRNGVITLPLITNADIDASGTGKELITKDYADANYGGGGDSIYSADGSISENREFTVGTHNLVFKNSSDGALLVLNENNTILNTGGYTFAASGTSFSANGGGLSLGAPTITISSSGNLKLLSEGFNPTVGQVWTATNTDGSGEWSDLPDDSLSLASTNTTDFNADAAHVGGMNDVDSVTPITLTIQDNATEDIPVGSIISYHQIDEGRIIIAYAGSASGDAGQTYKKGEVITLWHKSLDNWVIFNPPQPVHETISIATSDLTTDLTTGTDLGYFNMPFDMEIVEVRQVLFDAGTVSGITVDINVNGSSILSTLLTTDATEETSDTATTPAVLSTTILSKGDKITIDHDAVGTAQKGAETQIIGYRL